MKAKAVELVKQWEKQDHPRFPQPEFQIGDVVRLSDNDDPDELAVVVGMRLRYYSHMRRHVWYYEYADRTYCPSVTIKWSDAEDLEKASAETDSQKWHVTGGETPVVPTCECWECHQIRVDDMMDCPYCSAYATPF